MKTSTDNSVIRFAYGDMEAMRLIREAGFDGIDYSLFRMKPENDIINLPLPERRACARQLREYAESIGLSFPQAHAPFDLKYGEDEQSKNYIDIIRGMEFASYLGIKQIVVHSIKCPRSDRTIDVNGLNRAFFRGLIPYCEEYNIRIGVENLFIRDKKLVCFFGRQSTPEEMNDFIDSLDSPWFVNCCDVGHAAICGTEPQDFIRGMSPERMTMLHIQDGDYLGDRHWLPYGGSYDWEEITSSLAEVGYYGYMNLEVLHFYDRFPKELMPDALKLAASVARRLADKVEEKRALIKA